MARLLIKRPPSGLALGLVVLPMIGVMAPVTACGNSGGSPAASSEPAPTTAAPAAAPAGSPQSAQGLVFDLPAEWTSETPSSSMRAAQASIPGSGGPGQLSVFHFGVGGGGGVEANLQRWLGQMDTAEPDPERKVLTRGDFAVTWIEVGGTLKASSIGTFPETDQSGYRLYGAVVEGPGGPWFFRAVGPDASLREQREGFLAMLESVRAE